jgi:trigger factor
MNVDVKPAGACKVNVSVKADSSETGAEYKNVLNKYHREGQIKGFRKGRAPKEKLLQIFGADINRETETRLCRKLYPEALKQAEIKLVRARDIVDVQFSPETGLNFTLVADVEPEVKVPKYKGIAVKPQDLTVTEEEVDSYIEKVRAAFAKFENAEEEYAISRNDLVCIDYAGAIDGKPVKEVVPEAERISEAQDFWFQVEESQFIPEVVEELIGLRSGDEKTIKFKFSKTHPIEKLHGCKAVYEVKVKSIRQQICPADDELCKQAKQESMEDFRANVRERMLQSARETEEQRRKDTVAAHLLRKASFDLPESELADMVNNVLDQMLRRAQYHGMKKEEITAHKDRFLQDATKGATDQLRLNYIMQAIAEQEGIEASEDEIADKYAKMADDYSMKVEELRAKLAENGSSYVVKQQVVFEKTMEFLLQEAK